jgi:HSP20 family protein
LYHDHFAFSYNLEKIDCYHSGLAFIRYNYTVDYTYPAMMRTNLYKKLSTRFPPKLAFTVVRPAAVVFSSKISLFSTGRKGRDDDEFYNKTYSDAFDESDSLEKGKEMLTTLGNHQSKSDESGTSTSSVGPRAHFNGPIFRSLFGGFDDFFSHPSLMSRDPFAPFFSRRESPFIHSPLHHHPGMALLRSLSPGYEIKESDGTYEIIVDVPDGVKASDVAVELENDGTVLHLSGELRQEENGMLVSETRFEKRFTIGTNVDTDNITANLSDGVLVLTAPKLETEQKRKITITEKPHGPSEEEVIQKSFSDAYDESDWAEAGKVTHEK